MAIIEYIGYPKDHWKFNRYVWSLIIFWLLLPVIIKFISYLSYLKYKRNKSKNKSEKELNGVTLIVLGDLNHSPRMKYHTESFLSLGYEVNICGYLNGELKLKNDKNREIEIFPIEIISNEFKLPYLLFIIFKIFKQTYQLIKMTNFAIDENTKFVFIQNPPSLPILAIVLMNKLMYHPQIKICVDWHNLNWSILNLKYKNESHFVVKLMKKYESWFAKLVDVNITVTRQLGNYLVESFKVDPSTIIPFYDRPKNELFSPLNDQNELKEIISENLNLFNGYDQVNDRILVSSTSFTPDEDFKVLINSLKELDGKISGSKNKIWMIVTGKGPLQNEFKKMVEDYNWTNVEIKNVWLPIEQYPKVLKIADLGISLHYSSSGLDLPMKIVDLFGSGVPALTLNFSVISELVKNNQNGLIMNDNDDFKEMADKIYNVLFHDKELYLKIKQGALAESAKGWDEEWDSKLKPLFKLSEWCVT
ncbi:chitobiosyldiphosphodolichol beta-1,4 mannosyltransferase [Martiniozyma asiatica (nom. inval.)]|nr:chitobiosyldiphosphodolichol beta-1,4 mannosyltransferase [Martiniozyma asiatica]